MSDKERDEAIAAAVYNSERAEAAEAEAAQLRARVGELETTLEQDYEWAAQVVENARNTHTETIAAKIRSGPDPSIARLCFSSSSPVAEAEPIGSMSAQGTLDDGPWVSDIMRPHLAKIDLAERAVVKAVKGERKRGLYLTQPINSACDYLIRLEESGQEESDG